MSIEYKYVRPAKAANIKERRDAGLELKEDLKAKEYKDAVILPLKQTENSGTLFGRGGGYRL